MMDGLFQAISTRTAGFSVVNLANVHPALQVYYLVMMFIAVYPVAVGVHGTNVYEERSLGIYGTKHQDDDERKPSYVGAHIRNQLGFDLWYVFLVLFVVVLTEGPHVERPGKENFTIFAILFEVVSAYGTVGVSLGAPDINSSLSTKFSTLGKLAIVAAMIRGRHRSLPYKLDRAIMLPGDPVQRREDLIGGRPLQRSASIIKRSATF
jgi:Trk-type K+ transport system membrane component